MHHLVDKLVLILSDNRQIHTCKHCGQLDLYLKVTFYISMLPPDYSIKHLHSNTTYQEIPETHLMLYTYSLGRYVWIYVSPLSKLRLILIPCFMYTDIYL